MKATDVNSAMTDISPQPTTDEHRVLEAVTAVCVAYFSKNSVDVDDIAKVLRSIREGLNLADKNSYGKPATETPKVAAAGQGALFPIEGSVTEDRIRCLKCGKWFQELKRHLHEKHGMEPATYRAEVGLRADTPLVAPSTSAKRREASLRKGVNASPSVPPSLEVVEQANGDIVIRDEKGRELSFTKDQFEHQKTEFDKMMPEDHPSDEGARTDFAIRALYENAPYD